MKPLHTERMVPGTSKWQEGYAEHIVRYRHALQSTIALSALDIGCGVGYGANLLASRVPQVVAVDYSHEALLIASRRFSRENLTFVEDDAENLSKVVGSYDLITAFEIFEHIVHPERMLARAVELLNPNGVFFCSTPNALCSPKKEDGVTPRNPFHVREYTADEFNEAMRLHFSTVKVFGQCLCDRYLQMSSAMKNIAVQSMVRDLTLRSNPFVRLGEWIQKRRGIDLQFPEPKTGMFPPPAVAVMPPIEEDFVFRDDRLEDCNFLYAVCSN